MRYRLLGGSGLRVSEVALGSLTFGEAKEWGADKTIAAAILGKFADRGGTFLDTAPNYAGGLAEETVGAFLKGQRDEFVLSTKYTASNARHILAGGNGRSSMLRSVEASLKRLGTDHIDLLWVHYWDGTAPLAEILRGLDDLLSMGKIRYAGLSDCPAWITSRAATLAEWRGWMPLAAIQVEYNVAARTAERELLPMAEAMDLGVVAWGSLAAGALAANAFPRRRPAESLPQHLQEISAGVKRIATAHDLTPTALALRWLMRRATGPAIIPIIGARTVEQLTDSLDGLAGDLSADARAALNDLAARELGFPHELIASSYLRRLALGDPAALEPPARSRC